MEIEKFTGALIVILPIEIAPLLIPHGLSSSSVANGSVRRNNSQRDVVTDGRILVAYKIGRRGVGYLELILSEEHTNTRKVSVCFFAKLESAETIFNAPETKLEVAATIANCIVLLPMRDENCPLSTITNLGDDSSQLRKVLDGRALLDPLPWYTRYPPRNLLCIEGSVACSVNRRDVVEAV
jgi:hypothetical protein